MSSMACLGSDRKKIARTPSSPFFDRLGRKPHSAVKRVTISLPPAANFDSKSKNPLQKNQS
jgi:hypothetical protein